MWWDSSGRSGWRHSAELRLSNSSVKRIVRKTWNGVHWIWIWPMDYKTVSLARWIILVLNNPWTVLGHYTYWQPHSISLFSYGLCQQPQSLFLFSHKRVYSIRDHCLCTLIFWDGRTSISGLLLNISIIYAHPFCWLTVILLSTIENHWRRKAVRKSKVFF